MVASMLAGVLSVAWLSVATPGPVAFTIAVAVFQFGWNMTHPYLLGVFSRFDRSGQVVIYGTALQKIGLAAGPAAAAFVLAGNRHDTVLALSMALGIVAMLLAVPAARAQSKAVPAH